MYITSHHVVDYCQELCQDKCLQPETVQLAQHTTYPPKRVCPQSGHVQLGSCSKGTSGAHIQTYILVNHLVRFLHAFADNHKSAAYTRAGDQFLFAQIYGCI